jgi:hypothetical protein
VSRPVAELSAPELGACIASTRLGTDKHDGDGGEKFYAEKIRDAVAEAVAACAPGTSSRAIDSLTERFEEGTHFTVEPDCDEEGCIEPAFVLTQAGKELVFRKVFLDTRRRVPVPTFVRVWPGTACRPRRAARGIRRRPTTRTRGDPEPPRHRAASRLRAACGRPIESRAPDAVVLPVGAA